MSVLHALQHSHDVQNWLDKCLSSAQSADGIIFLEDAVSMSCHQSTVHRLADLDIKLSFYVLDVDLLARGLMSKFNQQSNIKFELVSYQEFVELTLQYQKLVNWA